MKKMEKITFSTTIDSELLEKFKIIAKLENKYINELLEEIISGYIADKEFIFEYISGFKDK